MVRKKSALEEAMTKRRQRFRKAEMAKLKKIEDRSRKLHVSEEMKFEQEYNRLLKEIIAPCHHEAPIVSFEDQQESIHHNVCTVCNCVSLNLKISRLERNKCTDCKGKEICDLVKESLLPIWINYDESPTSYQFELPKCLQDLTYAEMLLIQLISTFVPLHHIRNGTLGMKGHVCSFEQNVQSVCNTLPRLPLEVTMLKVIHTTQKEIGPEFHSKIYEVRKMKVMTALRWLKHFSKAYKDIEIAETKLDWMEGADTGILPVHECKKDFET